jgi:hypothetical protein
MNILVEQETKEVLFHFTEVMKSKYVSKSGSPLHLYLLLFHNNDWKPKVIYNSRFICVIHVS